MTKGWPNISIYFILILVMLTLNANSATLQELDIRLRHRVNEVDTTTSVFDTATSYAWLNMAQDRITVLSGYLPGFVDFEYTAGTLPEFVLPALFRGLDGVIIKSNKRFYSIFYNPNFAIDTPVIQYSLVWDNEDEARVVIKLGGFESVRVKFPITSNTDRYLLPEDFRSEIAVLLFANNKSTWSHIFSNPGFMIDTNIVAYSINWFTRDTAFIFIRQDLIQLAPGDTLAVFYRRSLRAGDTIRVLFHSIPTEMSTPSTECQLPDDLEEFVVEEAIGYYFRYKNDEIKAQSVWEQVRLDMGVLKERKQQ